MNIILPKFWKDSLKYEAVPEFLEGQLEYIADFDTGNYTPYAIFKAHKPNKEKGHKPYVGIKVSDGHLVVMGWYLKDLKPYTKRSALHCHNCDDLIYSLYRHDFRPCSCGNCAIDGGSDYTKISMEDAAKYSVGTLDLIKKNFKKG